ncbi:hypothetical protein ACFSQQ_01500 [Mesorhizobium kowhaii]|uniref:HK97 gp10 family phage protein n=2 Tax=Mesorhizobium TaxID=68287 RepID=A0ABW4WC39_9HYPH|nr:hypothetical protein [Mesorhizobium sophorae]
MSLLQVRTTINKIINSAAKGGDISTKTLIEALRKDYAVIISAAQSELETIALTKIVNEVARRRVREVPGQSELLGGYSGIWQTIVVKSRGPDGKLRYERKAINVATPEEVEGWLQEHTQTRRSQPEKFAGMRRMLEDARNVGGANGATIGSLLAEKRRRELAAE